MVTVSVDGKPIQIETTFVEHKMSFWEYLVAKVKGKNITQQNKTPIIAFNDNVASGSNVIIEYNCVYDPKQQVMLTLF